MAASALASLAISDYRAVVELHNHHKQGQCIRNLSTYDVETMSDGHWIPPNMSSGESCVRRMLVSLRDPAVGRITLHGLGGTGKTWAARRAVDWAEKESFFHVIIWVSLSAGSTPREVQQMILEKLPTSFRDDDVSDEGPWRSTRVRLQTLLRGIKFLLILDDLWWTEDDVLGMIGIPEHNPAVGSKVLVTTRSRRVVVTTQPDLVIEMAGLPFRESLELFLKSAGEAAAGNQSLQPLVHEVVHKCLGIPLAIEMVGRALRGSADAPAGVEGTLMLASSALGQGNMSAYRAAKLGYRLLPNDAAREFLLKCALFNPGVEVATQDPIRYCCCSTDGNDISIVVDGDVYETSRAMLTELLNRHLLYEDGEGRVMMHKVIREVLLDMGRESGNIYLRAGADIRQPPWERIWRNCVLIGVMDTKMEELPESPECSSLSTLLLSGNHLLKRIPERFFAHMQRLSTLDLSDTGIGRLPSSFRELSELRVLLLRRCVCLEEVDNVVSPKLEVLDLLGATNMRRVAWGTPSSPPPPSLAVLNLSETSIEELPFLPCLGNLRLLLLSGCQSLQSALEFPSLTKMEQLDLSGTALVDFPYGISQLTQLKRVRLSGSRYTRVEWRMIHWLPEGLTWDQSSGSDITIEPVEDGDSDGTAYISADNPRVFWSLDRDSPLWRSCFKKFHFCVCHPDAAAGGVRFQRKGFVFRDAYLKTGHFAHSERRDRHLEICGLDGFPQCIEGVLCNSELLSLSNIRSMKRLSDFGLADMRGMKECWIERCDQMETVLEGQELEFLEAEGCLGWLWVSNSTSLSCLFKGMGKAGGSFDPLRHLNIDCCPNLVCVFSSAMRLHNLETLQIKFCDGLEAVFGEPVSGEEALPRLHTMRLWELPQLKYVTDGVLPELKSLKVKQCPGLKKIPVGTSDRSPLVRIVGESWWWNSLKWDDQNIKYRLLFRKWGRL